MPKHLLTTSEKISREELDYWLCLLQLPNLLIGLSQLHGRLEELPGLVPLQATGVHVTFREDVLLMEEVIHKLLPFILHLKDLSLQTPLSFVCHPQHEVELRGHHRAEDVISWFQVQKRFVYNILEEIDLTSP